MSKEQNERYKKRRLKFIEMYGGQCSCCRENNIEFLTIEHKKGQNVGWRKRERSHQSYCRAIKEYQPDLYEILCMNCNHSKGKYGYCPHKRIKPDELHFQR